MHTFFPIHFKYADKMLSILSLGLFFNLNGSRLEKETLSRYLGSGDDRRYILYFSDGHCPIIIAIFIIIILIVYIIVLVIGRYRHIAESWFMVNNATVMTS